MNPPDAQRLQRDLDTIRQAAGLELGFRREHVYALAPFSLCGALCALWGWFARGLDPLISNVIGVVILFVPGIAYLYVKDLWPVTGDRAYQRRNMGPFLALLLVALGFVWWLMDSRILKAQYGELVFGVILGVYWLTTALLDRRMRAFVVLGAGFVLIPFLDLFVHLPFMVEMGLVGFAGSIGQALIWRAQLQQAGQWEA